MDDDVVVRKLVKLIFDKHLPMTAGTAAPDFSVPDYFLTKEFSENIDCVLVARRLVLFNRWVDDFNANIHKVLSSHLSYVTYVFKACLREHYCNLNVFDSFISVCNLVGYFNLKTLKRTGVNFYDLNSDIAMEFYDSVLKKIFHRRGGVRRLIEYISHHRYVMWNSGVENIISTYDSTTLCLKITEKLKKGLNTDVKSEKLVALDEKALEACISYAQKVISNTSVKLPSLPSYPDLIQTMVAYRRKQKAETSKEDGSDESSEPLEEFWACLSNSASKTNQNPKQEDTNIIHLQNIIQVVKRHNHAKSSGLANSDNHIQKKADGIMKHFKETIESLIHVLDEYDKE